ncbi:winged helix-turn-helix domain-containing protein [Lysobacter silvisoli]|nr:winged helix-turn-helix domain-containing protein [Lysobacter silvisoli]
MSRPPEPSPPLPSERLRVGECLVDVPLREILAPGARRARRITPKAMGVLLSLIEHQGRVVSRDTLLAEVWPDTLPTNDVVTQAITQLRKAFDDERGNPRYIETIAKNGYRLLTQVEWLQAEPGATAANAGPAEAQRTHDASVLVDPSRTTAEHPAFPEAPRDGVTQPIPPPAVPNARGAWTSIVGVVAGVALLVGAIVLWSLLRAPPRDALRAEDNAMPLPSERPYRLITSFPGFELSPTLSPDAAMVAYMAIPNGARGTAIMVQTTDQTQPRQLTRPQGLAEDSAPAWSPDGRSIAFLRIEPGVACRIMLIAANGGVEREVGSCDHRTPPTFSWMPDGRGLLFGSMPTASGVVGLRQLDLASGEWRALEYARGRGDLDSVPRYSPDGRWIVFVRNAPLGDFWRIRAEGGEAERLTQLRAELRGWDWLPDGSGLMFGRGIDGDIRMYRFDFESGRIADTGVPDAQSPVLSRTRSAAVFVQRRQYFGLYRVALPQGGEGSVHVVEPVYASSARDMVPSIAPDARQLAFVSDRSGSNGLWWGDLQRPDSLRMIAGVLPSTRYPANWSEDSRSLLIAGRDRAGVGALFEVVPSSGRVSQLPLPLPEPLQALYLPNRDRLLVLAGAGDGHQRLHLFDRRGQPMRALASLDDVSQVRYDRHGGRLLFTRPTRSGLWQADLSLSPGSVRQLNTEEPVSDRYRMWAVADDGQVRYIEQLQTCAAHLRRISADRAAAEPGTALPAAAPLCLDQSRRVAVNGYSLTPRGDVVYVALVQWDGADIGYMDLLPAPKGEVPGWFN